jgi:lipid-A-disaccharide synthase
MAELVRAWTEDPGRSHVQWALAVAPTLSADDVQERLGRAPVVLVENRSYALRAYADAALVCSGTATLETALLGTPFAILYKLNPLTYQLAKRLVTVRHFGLSNIVAGREISRELLQGEVNPEQLGRELERLLKADVASRMRSELAEIHTHLGQPGAADRVAAHLVKTLN